MAASPPILIWQPGGGTPPGAGPRPPITNSALTQLIVGQAYIDVTFDTEQVDNTWIFLACEVLNTTDLNPLNIWPGIITVKTSTGFRLYLNGLPDSINYFLNWAISGVNIAPPVPHPATTYTLTGPASGNLSVPSANFTVKLPLGGTVASPVTITLHDSDVGGAFTPSSLVLTTASPLATFTYTPPEYGGIPIITTNDGGLTDPVSLTYTCVASTYTLTGPSSGAVGVPSTNFTAALPVGGVVTGTVTVTPADGGGGGTFTPTTVALTTGAPSATFTYTPASAGVKTLSVTNSGTLTNPASLSYTSTHVFSPSDIAGLKLWLKADSLALADGANVSAWSDSSGNGNNMSTTTPPVFRLTGGSSGGPCVQFAGGGETLGKTPLAGGNIPQPNTLIGVFDAGRPLDNTGAHRQILGTIAGADFSAFAGTTIDSGMAEVANSFHIETAILNGASSTIYIDGILKITANAGTNGLDGVLLYTDGLGGAFAGKLCELLIYNSGLSSTDRGSVETYLRTKWGTP